MSNETCSCVRAAYTRTHDYIKGRSEDGGGNVRVNFFSQQATAQEKNKYIRTPRQINDRVIGFSRDDKRDSVKAGANTMNYIYVRTRTVRGVVYHIAAAAAVAREKAG